MHGYIFLLLYFNMSYNLTNFYTVYLIGQKFVGQNCRNFCLVSKILSDKKFCPSKILSNITLQKSGINSIRVYRTNPWRTLFSNNSNYILYLGSLNIYLNTKLRTTHRVRNVIPQPSQNLAFFCKDGGTVTIFEIRQK